MFVFAPSVIIKDSHVDIYLYSDSGVLRNELKGMNISYHHHALINSSKVSTKYPQS